MKEGGSNAPALFMVHSPHSRQGRANTPSRAPFHFVASEGTWKRVEGPSELEEEFARSVTEHLTVSTKTVESGIRPETSKEMTGAFGQNYWQIIHTVERSGDSLGTSSGLGKS